MILTEPGEVLVLAVVSQTSTRRLTRVLLHFCLDTV